MGYLNVVADIPPGNSSPNRNISQYEAVVVASLTDGSQQTWQFGFDPEMDVDNNNLMLDASLQYRHACPSRPSGSA